MRQAVIAGLLALSGAAQAQTQPSLLPLDTNKARYSYSVGADAGKALREVSEFVEAEAFEAGFRDALANLPARLTPEQREAAKKMVADVVQERKDRERKLLAQRNQKEADEFLAANRVKPGIGTTPSGLQYEVLQQGEGASPSASSGVTVLYKGTLPNGTVFDQTEKDKPAQFPLNKVIPGWTEGLQLMKPGSKFRFFVPPALAYADRGAGDLIGPSQLLIFEVELLGVQSASAAPAAEGHPNFN